jgi:hypothetical protein
MDQVPHWLEKTVFAAGMTAYAVEVDAKAAAESVRPLPGIASEDDDPDLYH